ncbi:MAG: hypothetical protein DRQ47_09415, partial [Gammaproteobacteria bacterium]
MAILNAGNGADGSITISVNKNINSDLVTGGRLYADGVYSKVNVIGASSVTLPTGLNGLAAGDEVMLINLMGRTGNIANAGNYEFFTVGSIVSNTVNFSQSVTKSYGDDGGNGNLISHPVMIQRIPNYVNVTIDSGAILTADDPPEGASMPIELGGVVAFRCSDTLNISNGYINTNIKGYSGGGAKDSGYYDGYGIGGGKMVNEQGSGGGYGTAGEDGDDGSVGGTDYGVANLSKLFLGSGGGSGDYNTWMQTGGDGGGIIFVSAYTITITTGGLTAKGGKGGGPDTQNGGGGSGGSIMVYGKDITIPNGTITAEKGLAGDVDAGDGGDGRIAVFYDYLTGTLGDTTPAAYTEVDLQLPAAYKISG